MVNEKDLSAIDQLKKAVIDQKKMSLPLEPPAPVLGILHRTVADYDQVVSLAVIRAIQGNPTGDIIAEPDVSSLRAQIDIAMQDEKLANNRKVDFYRRYTLRLDRMLKLALQVKSSNH